MNFIADLHIHSRFSRATGKRLNAPLLAAWAAVKGIAVLGTGDFTHPLWREELKEGLEFDEASGLYTLRQPPKEAEDLPRPAAVGPSPFFMLQAEISSIYKRGGQVRKVHNLVYMPDFDAADRFCRRLEQVGNLASDGRPILGLDSRHVLEMALEADARAALIPAHIWTPWFSLFGSKSGFDSLEECYGDLSSEIFALETGLSSDPAMNRLWSALDRFRMVSNSDAHSAENLGREATLFSGPPSYDGIFNALRGQGGPCAYAGTLEFYPEEGKYHLDGHRDCNVVLEPHESRELGDICPVCKKPLTVGVLHRVLELADRNEPATLDEPDFASLIPLSEILGELLGVGSKSRRVAERYAGLLERFGPELEILHRTDIAELRRHWDALGEAVERMRTGRVIRKGGYDGEYGVIRVFTDEERRDFAVGGRRGGLLEKAGGAARLSSAPAGATMFAEPSPANAPLSLKAATAADSVGLCTYPPSQRRREPHKAEASAIRMSDHTPNMGSRGVSPLRGAGAEPLPGEEGAASAVGESLSRTGIGSRDAHPQEKTQAPLPQFSEEQRAALEAGPEPVLVLAGPGAGKTRVLVGRLLRLLESGVPASRIVAFTFTRRAATELESRLRAALGGGRARMPAADTLHALAYAVWHKLSTQPPMLLSEEAALRLFRNANADMPARRARAAWERLSTARERLMPCPEDLAEAAARYADAKADLALADYTDLLEFQLARLREGALPFWEHVLVDEAQDLSPLQLELIRAMLPPDGRGFFGIGDPDQSIYSFRGAEPDVPGRLREYWPDLRLCRLARSYRSAPAVLEAANALPAGKGACGALVPVRKDTARLQLFSAPGDKAEARKLAELVRGLLGGTSHTLADREEISGRPYSPGDIAVLVRVKALIPVYKAALEQFHIPCSAPEAEAFWHDPRVELLLAGAQRFLGLADQRGDGLECPAEAWAEGPAAAAAALEGQPPFDALFGDSHPLRELERLWRGAGGWKELFTQLHFLRDLEQVRERSEQVRILTLHAAKGLEFRAVFLPALEEGLLPFDRGVFGGGERTEEERIAAREAEAEELRLFYVGISRAADALFLSHAAQRRLYGRTLSLAPSPFLGRVRHLFRASTLVAHARATGKQLPLL